MINLDFSDIEDPVGFILEERVDFLHKFKGMAALINNNSHVPQSQRTRAVRYKLAHDMNNYRIIISNFGGRIPSLNTETDLLYLVSFMNLLWDGRKNLDLPDVLSLADHISDSYESLVDSLKRHGKQTK